jgi:hypothetical protein
MASTRAIRSVSIDDFFYGVHAAQSCEMRIAQSVFDLEHPVSQGALDPIVHFADDRFNQFPISCNACQSRTQPF